MNYFIKIILFLGSTICNTSFITAQTDSVSKINTQPQRNSNRVAKSKRNYDKLSKKKLNQLIEIHLVNPIIKETDSNIVRFTKFKYQYHNLDKKRKIKIKKGDNILLGTVYLIKINGEIRSVEFKLSIMVSDIYNSYFEWWVRSVSIKKNDDDDEWLIIK